MAKPQITQEQIDGLLAALTQLEPVQEDSAADRLFDAVSPTLKAKLEAGCTSAQIIELFRSQGIQLGSKRVAKFLRGLAPKKRKRSRRRTAATPAVATAAPAANPKPTVQPEQPPQVKPTPTSSQRTEPPAPVGAGGPTRQTTTSTSTSRRSNASLGDSY